MLLLLRGRDKLEPDESVTTEFMTLVKSGLSRQAKRFMGESFLVARPVRLLANTLTTSQVSSLGKKSVTKILS